MGRRWPSERQPQPMVRPPERDDRYTLPAPVSPDRAGASRADLGPAARRAAALRRGPLRRVRGQPDDGPQRDAAARRGRPDPARTRPRQLRRGASDAPPREPPDDLHSRDAPGRPGAELADPDAG